jgi:hypothetical protein
LVRPAKALAGFFRQHLVATTRFSNHRLPPVVDIP